MTQINQTIDCYAGDSQMVFIALTGEDGSPLDPTTLDEIEWRLAKNNHGDALVAKTLGAGIDLAEGGILLTLTSTETNLFPGTYYHQCTIWDGDAVSVALTGAFVIRRCLAITGRRIQAQLQLVGASSLAVTAS